MSVNSDPTEFSATIEYSADITYFQYITIKNNGTVEFAGYVENITPSWDKTGRILEIGGRHISVILWKKFTERFSDSRTEGFFGACDPAKLIGFLLRCPVSDSPVGLPRHKIGWGIYPLAPSMWGFTSSYTDLTTTKNYVISRISGFAWKKGAEPYSGLNLAIPNNDSGFDHTTEEWTGGPYSGLNLAIPNDTSGFDETTQEWAYTGDEPWIATDDGDTSFIQGTAIGQIMKYFILNDMGDNWDTITSAVIYVKAKTVTDAHSVSVRVRLNVGAGDVVAGELSWTESDYTEKSLDVFSIVDTKTKANACKISLEFSAGAGAPDSNPRVTYVVLQLAGNLEPVGEPWIATDDGDTSFIQATTLGQIQKYFILNDMGDNWGETITSAVIYVKAKSIGGDSVTVKVWLNIGGADIDAGDISWTETDYTEKSLDVFSIVDTKTKANACKISLEFSAGAGAPDSNPRVTYVVLQLAGKLASNQKENDYFKIDLNEVKTRLTGIIIESRKSSDKYARNYAIETSVNGSDWTSRATKSSNTARDIIESWAPVDTERYIRIRITANAAFDWEISQIYVYCADNHKYCIWDEGSGADLGPYLSGTLTYDNYIGTYGTITPINIPFSRMNDALNDIVQKCHDANFDVWELWVDNSGVVHFEDRRGSDKSGSISFIKGTNLESVKKEGKTKSVVSRTRLVGKAESKKQDEISSDWQINTTAETALGTFFEEVESSKRVSDKDTADVIAKVKVRTEGNPEEVFSVHVSNDTYNPLAYVVGDDVTVTDSLTGMSGSYRIRAIKKIITENGEDITLYCGSKWKDFSDEWAETRRQLREVGLGNTTIEDWLGEGADQGKLSGDQIGDLWGATYKYKETPAVAEYKPAYTITGDTVNGQTVTTFKDQFILAGVSRTGAGGGDSVQATIDTISCNWSNNPRFICEIEVETGGNVWETDDNCYMHMEGVGAGLTYFGFQVIRTGGNYVLRAVMFNNNLYTVDLLNLVAGTKYRLEALVNWTDKIVRYYIQGGATYTTRTLIAILEIPIGAANDALYVMEVLFSTMFSGAGQSVIRFWSWKSQYTY